MTHPEPTYRLLTTADTALFREVRLRACREEPASFLEAPEELEGQPESYFERYFANGWIAGAFLGQVLVGICGLYRLKGVKTRHKGTVWRVYVAPEARGLSAGRVMISILLESAKADGVEAVTLSTDASNPVTAKLYQSLGFEPYGVEKHVLKLADGRYIDDVWMLKLLK